MRIDDPDVRKFVDDVERAYQFFLSRLTPAVKQAYAGRSLRQVFGAGFAAGARHALENTVPDMVKTAVQDVPRKGEAEVEVLVAPGSVGVKIKGFTMDGNKVNGIPPQHARLIAEALLEAADEAEKGG